MERFFNALETSVTVCFLSVMGPYARDKVLSAMGPKNRAMVAAALPSGMRSDIQAFMRADAKIMETAGALISSGKIRPHSGLDQVLACHDAVIQRLLREVDTADVANVISVSAPEVQDAFYRNLSERANELLKEDVECRGQVGWESYDKARERIIELINQKNSKESRN